MNIVQETDTASRANLLKMEMIEKVRAMTKEEMEIFAHAHLADFKASHRVHHDLPLFHRRISLLRDIIRKAGHKV